MEFNMLNAIRILHSIKNVITLQVLTCILFLVKKNETLHEKGNR